MARNGSHQKGDLPEGELHRTYDVEMAEETKQFKEFADKRKLKTAKVTIPARFEPRFWEDGDSRRSIVKLMRRRYKALHADAGGERSAQRDILIQRASFISIILETWEVRLAEGENIELGAYTQMVNALTGLLTKLGLEKHVRDVTDLKDYLKRRQK